MNTTRTDTLAWLHRWRQGDASAEQVWQWASECAAAHSQGQTEYEDELVRDVIDVLAALPQDLIILEDADVMIYGLENPADEADLAQNLLWNHLDTIDSQARRQLLADDPFYGPFCADVI